jgi:hypothetical protein
VPSTNDNNIPFARIFRALGKGYPRLSIITSAIIVLTCFFYLFTLGSYFKVGIYILVNRVTYSTLFDFYIINKYIDHAIIISGIVLWLALSLKGKARFVASGLYGVLAVIGLALNSNILIDICVLASVPIVIFLLISHRWFIPKNKEILNVQNELLLDYIATIAVITGIIGIIVALAPIFFPISSNSMPRNIPNYAYDIFLLFSSFSPVLIFFLLSSFPMKLLIKEFVRGIYQLNTKNDSAIPNDSIKRTNKIVYLSVFMILSLCVVIIPHQPIINTDKQHVGVDTHFYVSWINALTRSNDSWQFLQQAFAIQGSRPGDRPFTLIFLFVITKIGSIDLFQTIEYVPLILGPGLVVVVYFLTRELIPNNDTTPLFASFITAISFQTLIGIYSGFYANWIALILGYLALVFLLRFLKRSGKLNFVVYSSLVIALLFSHVYTWSVLIIVMALFLVVLLTLNYYRRKSIILLLVVILFSIVIDIGKTSLTGSSGGIDSDIQMAPASLNIHEFFQRWDTLVNVIQTYYGGLFSNFIILILGLYWLFFSRLREPSTILLMAFFSIGTIPLFFGGSEVQARILYNIPFQIPAAIALTYIKQTNKVLLSSILIWLIAMSTRAVSNFHLVLPT